MDEHILTLTNRLRELRQEMNEVQYELEGSLYNFKGTVKEALVLGLVRANFPTSVGFKRAIIEERK